MPLPAHVWVLFMTGLILAGPPSGASELRAEGMTFVGTSGAEREVLLHSRLALFQPADGTAELTDVDAEVSVLDEGLSFTMQCDAADLNVESNDFVARGDVRGETATGQRYRAPWVRYDHEEGVLSTDSAVTMEDDSGNFRGDGFRYHMREKRFQLLGNVRVEQTP